MTEQVDEKAARKRVSPAEKAQAEARAEASRIDKADGKVEKAQAALTEAQTQRAQGVARLTYLLAHPDLGAEVKQQFTDAYLEQPDVVTLSPRAVVDSPQA